MVHTRIAYAAGKSGGHMIPCLTLFHEAQSHDRHLSALFFTSNAPLDATIVSDVMADTVICRLPVHSRITNPLKYLVLLCGLLVACLKSAWYLLKYKPSRIVTTGGITAVPVCLVGYLFGIPIDLYELNAVVGRATRFLAPLATRIRICFPEAQSSFRAKACIITPYPIRFAIPEHVHFPETRTMLGLQPDIPVITVLGGSQGSVQLNRFIKQALLQYTKPVQIIHQTGHIDTTDWAAWYEAHTISALVFPYRDDLSSYIIAADLIICRAGAGTLFECMAYKKKMIIIPLEGVADDHQVANAYACQRRYQEAFTLRQDRLTHHPTLLSGTIETFLHAQQHQTSSHEYVHTMR